MKHLFVARHGSYGGDERIDDTGRWQMKRLGRDIKQVLCDGSVYLVSSTAPRALDSSEVLAAELALPPEFERVPYLWSGTDAPGDSFYRNPNLDRLIEIVDERRDMADGLVMVTHSEVVESFPAFFLEREFGRNEHIIGVAKGRAVHFDLEQRTYQIIPKSTL